MENDELTMLEMADVQNHWHEGGGNPSDVLSRGTAGLGAWTPAAKPPSAFDMTWVGAKQTAEALRTPLAQRAREAAERMFVIAPKGTESRNEILDRIAAVYYYRRYGTWTMGEPTMWKVVADPTFHQSVNSVCPTCPRRDEESKPSDFTSPSPGAVEAKTSTFDQILGMVKKGLQSWNDGEQRKLAEQVRLHKQAGGKIYVPKIVKDKEEEEKAKSLWGGLPTGGKVGIVIGGVALGALLFSSLMRPRRRAVPTTTYMLPAPR